MNYAGYNNRSTCKHRLCCSHCPSINCPVSKPINRAGLIEGCFGEFAGALQINSGDNFTANILTKNARTITVFVKNTGHSRIVISLQNSPNGLDFTDDPQQLELDVNETGYLVPYVFSKYMRIVAKSNHTGAICIWVQMQNHSYWHMS